MAHQDPAHTLDDAASVAKYHIYGCKGVDEGLVGQFTQRIDLVRTWGIKPGSRVLEIGCGQGDCTLAIAAAVGSEGHVTALDPARLDYGKTSIYRLRTLQIPTHFLHPGAPYNLGDAQEYIKAGALGTRITFVQIDPLAFMKDATERFDVAILAQSSWYFSSPKQLQETLRAASKVATRVCISEYALSSVNPLAAPHVLAVLAQAGLECRKPTSDSNVRTVLSPSGLVKLAKEGGLRLVTEKTVQAPETMHDGRWEVGAIRDRSFVEQINQFVRDPREVAVVNALRDATLRAAAALPEGKKVATMDIWVAEFVADP
jgi:SAM-dependent methyltransferase